jgi:hypothetical protein
MIHRDRTEHPVTTESETEPLKLPSKPVDCTIVRVGEERNKGEQVFQEGTATVGRN